MSEYMVRNFGASGGDSVEKKWRGSSGSRFVQKLRGIEESSAHEWIGIWIQ